MKRGADKHVVVALVKAFERGERNGGSIDWEELEEVYRMAISALEPRQLVAIRKNLDQLQK